MMMISEVTNTSKIIGEAVKFLLSIVFLPLRALFFIRETRITVRDLR